MTILKDNILRFYPVIHGFVLAISYGFIKLLDFKGSLLNLLYALVLSLFLLQIYKSYKKEKLYINRSLIFKGLMFGVTQLLLFSSLKMNGVSATLISAFVGAFFAALLGRVLLKEDTLKTELIGYLIILLGCVYYISFSDKLNYYSIISIIAGFTQGITFFLTRKVSIEKINFVSNIYFNLSVGSLVIFCWYLFTDFSLLAESINNISVVNIFSLSFLVLVSQFSLVFMMKKFNSQRSSILSLSRLPFSFLVDYFIFSYTFDFNVLFTTCLIVLGIFVCILNQNIYFFLRKV